MLTTIVVDSDQAYVKNFPYLSSWAALIAAPENYS